jgi:hypothetical protein
MATERQQQLEQVFRFALEEHGPGVSTEFLIAATSERTQADPREIIRRLRTSIDDRGPRVQTRERAARMTTPLRFCWRWEKRSPQFGAICPKTSSTNYSNTRSPLKMTRRESDSPFFCMRYTFARPMGSRHAPSRNPTVWGDRWDGSCHDTVTARGHCA